MHDEGRTMQKHIATVKITFAEQQNALYLPV